MTEITRELHLLLGELLEYPDPDLAPRAARCRRLLSEAGSAGAAPMAEFAAFVEDAPSTRLEELYTAAFDLAPQCSPYLGYHLLGEDPKRTLLMVRLQEVYRSSGFSTNGELPDHVAVLLRFLAAQQDATLERELVDDLLAPALQKMAPLLEEENPYRHLLLAAALALGRRESGSTVSPGSHDDREV